ncbi:MAG: hypothetical protein A3E80_01920 [Chlamydiae bacterium RIFCSPHIGHO2_12_FULL_49_9]|nr:MAG: hypothetical protein A3E80_01920 [Chlamydiae bacterium RIFCSPHIGHO2_12_FULL_49_9]
MAKRARRKAKSRKTARKAVKRETALRKKSKKAGSNKRAHWSAFRTLQKRVDKAWGKLRSDVKKKASAQVILKDRNELLLLLGECNYMAKECMRVSRKKR